MAEHQIETRILLRYDTLSNWMESTTILREGEVAIAKISFGTSIVASDYTPTNTPPAIGLKVGDGFHYFSELPWVQAVAGDVYSWAKQPYKPTYNANEIQNLDSFIEEHAGSGSGGSGNITARIYQLIEGTDENSNKYYLRYKTADDNDWTIDNSHYIDLTQLSQIANWLGQDLNDFLSLYARIRSTINTELKKINVTDTYEEGKVVVSVNQTNGTISTEKRSLNFNNLSGVLSVTSGGTGLTSINLDQILVGSNNNSFTTRSIETTLTDNTNLATNRAIKNYIDNKTAGLTGAMHYIGEAAVEINSTNNSHVNPQIPDYDFSHVQAGDVVTFGTKEFVWSGGWRLLGDEGSYAIKGSIVNADISPEAEISQSKIANLIADLSGKVNIVEGKGLSTNDYTNDDKNKLSEIQAGAQVNAIEHIFVNNVERPIVNINGAAKSIALSIDVFDEEHATKLDGIQAGAQVNTIEHIFVNGEERSPTTVNNLTKSVNIQFNPYTIADQSKLNNIEENAQVNKIESIIINGTAYPPNENKAVNITLDESALNLSLIDGAFVPSDSGETEEVTITNKKLSLAAIAKSGDIRHLQQLNNTYIVLDCGSSTEVI